MLNYTSTRVTGVNQDGPKQTGTYGHSHSVSCIWLNFQESPGWLMPAPFGLILRHGARAMRIHLLPPCRLRWDGSTSWSFPTFSYPPFLHHHQKLWIVAWPLSGDGQKAVFHDHLHYIQMVIIRLVFYYLMLIFVKSKKKLQMVARINHFDNLCVSVSWSILALSVSFSPLGCGHLEDKGQVLLTLVSSFLITVLEPCQAFLQLPWSLIPS